MYLFTFNILFYLVYVTFKKSVLKIFIFLIKFTYSTCNSIIRCCDFAKIPYVIAINGFNFWIQRTNFISNHFTRFSQWSQGFNLQSSIIVRIYIYIYIYTYVYTYVYCVIKYLCVLLFMYYIRITCVFIKIIFW